MATSTRTRKAPAQFVLLPSDGVPTSGTGQVVAAASLLAGVLKHCRVETVAELAAAVADPTTVSSVTVGRIETLLLGSEQRQLLSEWAPQLAGVRISPTVAVAWCPVCERWWYTSGSVAGCKASRSCEGRALKSTANKRVNAADEDFAESVAEVLGTYKP